MTSRKPIKTTKTITKGSKAWNDNIFELHPRMKEVVKKSPKADDAYVYIICENNRSSHCSGFVKNMLSHFEDSKTHKKFILQEGLSMVNEELIAVMRGDGVSVKSAADNSYMVNQPALSATKLKHKKLRLDL